MYNLGRLVVDRTGLKGDYYGFLHFSADEIAIPSIQEQFGLRFEAQRASVDILVIDHLEKPSEN